MLLKVLKKNIAKCIFCIHFRTIMCYYPNVAGHLNGPIFFLDIISDDDYNTHRCANRQFISTFLSLNKTGTVHFGETDSVKCWICFTVYMFDLFGSLA